MHKKFLRTSAVVLICASSWSTTMEAMEEIFDEDDPRHPSSIALLLKEDERIKNKKEQEIRQINYKNNNLTEGEIYEQEKERALQQTNKNMSYQKWFENNIWSINREMAHKLEDIKSVNSNFRTITHRNNDYSVKTGYSSTSYGTVDHYEYRKGHTWTEDKFDQKYQCTKCLSFTQGGGQLTPEIRLTTEEKNQLSYITFEHKYPEYTPCQRPSLSGPLKEIWDQQTSDSPCSWKNRMEQLWSAARKIDINNGCQTNKNWTYTIKVPEPENCCSICTIL